jgi:hypothetical protein
VQSDEGRSICSDSCIPADRGSSLMFRYERSIHNINAENLLQTRESFENHYAHFIYLFVKSNHRFAIKMNGLVKISRQIQIKPTVRVSLQLWKNIIDLLEI